MKIRTPLALLLGFLGGLIAVAQEEVQERRFDIGVIDVPEGDTADVAEFLQELSELQSNLDKEYRQIYADYRSARAKVAAAQSNAANRILNDPDVSDEQFAIAAKFGLASKLRAIGNQPAAEKRQVLAMVKRQLSLGVKKGVQRTELNNASTLVSYLERGGDFDLAIEACDSFAEMLKDVDDANAKTSTARFNGIARRLGLLGNPIELTGKLLDGSEFDWDAYKGKVVLVDFWATWCGPCIAEAPNVLKNYNRYHDRGFEVVGISLDSDKAKLENYVKSKKVPWVNLFQSGAGWKHPMAQRYGVNAIPTVFLVNREGNVVSLRARGAELGKQLKRLLETKEDLQREIAALSQQIEADPQDASLLSRRANTYIGLKDWELALSDWRQAVAIQPDLAQQAFAAFKTAEQWLSAAEFGMVVVEQKPEDIMRWLRLSAVLATSKDRQRYGEFCHKMVKQFKDSDDWRDSRITCKSCLLLPGVIPMDQLPQQEVANGFDGEHTAYTLAWSWNLQAIVAYRNGNAELALECLKKSEKNSPVPYAKALNYTLFALAYQKLGQDEKAEQAVKAASQYVERYRSEQATKYHHDVMIAEIMLQEAKSEMSGKR